MSGNTDRQRAAYDRYHAEYDRTVARTHAMLTPYSLDRWAARCTGRDVLDVGCGTGYVLERLLAAGGSFRSYTGVDISEAMTASNQARHGGRPGVRFLVDDAERLARIPEASHDVAVAFGCLHHLERPERAVAAIARALRPGGALLALELNRPHPADGFAGCWACLLGLERHRVEGAWAAVRGLARRLHGTARSAEERAYTDHHPGHPGKRSPDEYRSMLAAAGFVEARVRALYLDLLPYGVMRGSLPAFRVAVALSRPLLARPRLAGAGTVLLIDAARGPAAPRV